MAKVIYEETINEGTPEEEVVVRSWTVVAGAAATFVKTRPGVGKQYWCWNTVPAGTIVGVDLTGAPTASSVTATNQADINAITDLPADKLSYA